MARVQFINAILTGKLGGTVYSKNKGGAYTRQLVKPTNPRTPAQTQARGRFNQAATGYSNVSDTIKQGWNQFAMDFFSPKTIKPGVTYTGFNAYVSLNSASLNAKALKSATDPTIALPAASSATFLDFQQKLSAPVAGLSAQIQGATPAIPINVRLNDFVYTSGGFTTLKLGLDAGGGAPITTPPVFKDFDGGIEVGYIVYGSSPMPNAQSQPKKTEQVVVAVVPPIDTITGWTSGDEIDFEITAPTNFGGTKFTYQTGQWVKFTCYVMNKYGQMQLIGSVTSEVTA